LEKRGERKRETPKGKKREKDEGIPIFLFPFSQMCIEGRKRGRGGRARKEEKEKKEGDS